MIIEGLLSTEQADGSPHIAAMGPVVNEDLTLWTLRPFQSSTTFQLLRANPHCVFHVVDDVVPVVQAALGLTVDVSVEREMITKANSNEAVHGVWVIRTACHWFHLRVNEWDISQPRSLAHAEVISKGVLRPFWGWNRAKHAVLEATILATRLHLIDRATLPEELARLEIAVAKTAGPREQRAWQLLLEYIATH